MAEEGEEIPQDTVGIAEKESIVKPVVETPEHKPLLENCPENPRVSEFKKRYQYIKHDVIDLRLYTLCDMIIESKRRSRYGDEMGHKGPDDLLKIATNAQTTLKPGSAEKTFEERTKERALAINTLDSYTRAWEDKTMSPEEAVVLKNQAKMTQQKLDGLKKDTPFHKLKNYRVGKLLQGELAKIKEQMKTPEFINAEIADKLSLLRFDQDDDITQEFRSVIKEFVSKTNDFFADLENDRALQREINRTHVDTIIDPLLKAMISEGRFTEDKRNEFFVDIADDIDSINPATPQLLGMLVPNGAKIGPLNFMSNYFDNNEKHEAFALLKLHVLKEPLTSLFEWAYSSRNPTQYAEVLAEVCEDKGRKKEFAEIFEKQKRPDKRELPYFSVLLNTPTIKKILGNDFEEIRAKAGSNEEPPETAKDFAFYLQDVESVVSLAIGAFQHKADPSAESKRYLSALSHRPDWKETVEKVSKRFPKFAKLAEVIDANKQSGDSEFEEPDGKNAVEELMADFLVHRGVARLPILSEQISKANNTEVFLKALLQQGIATPEQAEALSGDGPELAFLRNFTNAGSFFKGTTSENEIKNLLLLASRATELAPYINQSRTFESWNTIRNFALNHKVNDATFEFGKNLIVSEPEFSKMRNGNWAFTHPETFMNGQGIAFIKEFAKVYRGTAFETTESRLMGAINNKLLSFKRVLELRDKLDEEGLKNASINPELFLQTDDQIVIYSIYRQGWEKEEYKELWRNSIDALQKTAPKDRKYICLLPEKCSWLLNDQFKSLTKTLLTLAPNILKSEEDIQFVNQLVGLHGAKAEHLLRGYAECLQAGAVSDQDKALLLEFSKSFRVFEPAIIEEFKKAKEEGRERMFLVTLNSMAEKMLGNEYLTDEERNYPYYQGLLRHVYPNNAGSTWGSYKSIATCQDRTKDIQKYVREPKYDIDVLSQGAMFLKDGESYTEEDETNIWKDLYEGWSRLEDLSERLRGQGLDSGYEFEEDIQAKVEEMKKNGVELPELPPLPVNENVFLIVTHALFKDKKYMPEAKKILLDAILDKGGIREWLKYPSTDISEQYARLSQLNEFYSDTMKDFIRKIVDNAATEDFEEYTRGIFDDLSQKAQQQKQANEYNKLQPDKLGMSDGFLLQAGKILERRYGRQLSTVEIRKIVSRYEAVTGGLSEAKSTSEDKTTQAFYGVLKSQRSKTLEALKMVTGEDVDATRIHLGEISLKEAIVTERKIEKAEYNKEEFARYLSQCMIDIFSEERGKVALQLSKFESESGAQRKVLRGYVTKTKESAHARMVGGVCVGADNPGNYNQNSIWGMEEYLQLVFQNPETLVCQGLVLMHDYTDQGKRVLCVSLNPSETYTQASDERALFKGIMGALEKFAADNKFDMIASSTNTGIRTNRTGGLFEGALDERVNEVHKKFRFDEEKTFSYYPSYNIQDMDVLWEKPASSN